MFFFLLSHSSYPSLLTFSVRPRKKNSGFQCPIRLYLRGIGMQAAAGTKEISRYMRILPLTLAADKIYF